MDQLSPHVIMSSHPTTLRVGLATARLSPTLDAGVARHVFEVAGARVGVVICHEGWRYPETVRWAARHGAQVVFHPHYHGSETTPAAPRRWCDPDGPFHELAMRARAAENTVYYAGVNYALPNQECASAVVAPDGT